MSTADATATAVHRFFRAVDRRNWNVVLAGLADTVETDYVSLFGGAPETTSGGELVDRWRGLLPGFDATQHLLGPLVPGADDTWECNVRAHHRLDGRTWMVAGWYVLRVLPGEPGPVIGAITLETAYETGGRDLVTAAQERASAVH